uniref:Uncharacterized protein n=1 Tax=Anguilla anguilla TaxID=7936 RepID=A0A0E9W6X2_ANGAN
MPSYLVLCAHKQGGHSAWVRLCVWHYRGQNKQYYHLIVPTLETLCPIYRHLRLSSIFEQWILVCVVFLFL